MPQQGNLGHPGQNNPYATPQHPQTPQGQPNWSPTPAAYGQPYPPQSPPTQHPDNAPSPYQQGGYPQATSPQAPQQHGTYPQAANYPPQQGQPSTQPSGYPAHTQAGAYAQARSAYPPAQPPSDPTTGRPARIQQPQHSQPPRAPQQGLPQRQQAGPQPAFHDPFPAAQSYVPPVPQAHVPQTHVPQAHVPQASVPPGYGSTGLPQRGSESRFDSPPTGRPVPQPGFDPWPANQPDPRSQYTAGGYPGDAPARDPRTGQHPPLGLPPQGQSFGQPQVWQPALSADPSTGRPTGGRGATHAGHPGNYEPDLTPAYAPPVPAGQALETADDEYDDIEDDAPRRPRYFLIAASLVLAITAGGGLAYAYKTLFSPPKTTASTPVVRNAQTANREKPANPGGTKIGGADSKLMENLSGSSDGGPRTVRTQTVRLDGSVAENSGAGQPPQPVTMSAVAAAQSNTAQPIPGMTVVLPPRAPPATTSAFPQAAQPSAAQSSAAPAPPPAQGQASSAPGSRLPAAPVKPTRLAVAPAAEADPSAVVDTKPVTVRKTVAAPSGVGASAVGSGFVAVLASVPATAASRAAALQQFDAMQQKYGAALAGKAPDVVEAQIADKGTYHRLVVGPPASREAATGVCTQLKAAGYTASCWVTAF